MDTLTIIAIVLIAISFVLTIHVITAPVFSRTKDDILDIFLDTMKSKEVVWSASTDHRYGLSKAAVTGVCNDWLVRIGYINFGGYDVSDNLYVIGLGLIKPGHSTSNTLAMEPVLIQECGNNDQRIVSFLVKKLAEMGIKKWS